MKDSIINTIDTDALKQSRAITSRAKSGNLVEVPFKLARTIGASELKLYNVDTSLLRVATPGRNSYSEPGIYILPEASFKTVLEQDSSGEFSIQNNMKVYAAVSTRAKMPEWEAAMPMRPTGTGNSDIQFLDQGKNFSTVNNTAIITDKDGFIWIAGMQQGAWRYDGSKLQHFTEREGMATGIVTSLFEDSKGNIWMGHWTGVNKFDGKSFTSYLNIKGIGPVNFRAFAETSDGSLWFGTRKGLFKLNGDTLTHYTEKQGLIRNKILSLAADKKGNIWIGTASGVSKFDGSSFTHFTEEDGLPDNLVLSVCEDKGGDIWFGSGRGPFRFDGDSFISFSGAQGVINEYCSVIYNDREGMLWFAIKGQGLFMYDGSELRGYGNEEGLKQHRGMAMTEDRDGNIWYSTYGGGVMRIRKHSFQTLRPTMVQDNWRLESIIEDQEGSLCFGFDEGGFFRYDGKTFSALTEDEGINYNIKSMVQDQKGAYWLTTAQGLQKYSGDSITTFEPGLDSIYKPHYVSSLFCDYEDNIWMGTWNAGLLKFDGKNFVSYSGIFKSLFGGPLIGREAANKGQVSTIFMDRDSTLWFSSMGFGLCKIEGDKLVQYQKSNGHLLVGILCSMQDSKGNFWLGTLKNGLISFDGKVAKRYGLEEGMSSDGIFSIIEDGQNRIWVGTENGLSILVPRADGTYEISVLGLEDGLRKLKFNHDAVCLDKQNRLWWGTGEFITMLDLNNFTIWDEPPVIHMSDLLINQSHIDFASLSPDDKGRSRFSSTRSRSMRGGRMSFTELSPFFNSPFNPEFSHNMNHLTFVYTAIDWSAPEEIGYRYMVEGLDEMWSPVSSDGQADYRNLPPGRYVFKVRAIGKSKLWSSTLDYPFVIHRAWWASIVAVLVYILLILVLLRYYIRYIIKRERLSAEYKVQEVELTQIKELEGVKNRFFAGISHEFRTPLTLLLGPLSDLLKDGERHQNADLRLMGMMKRNVKRLQQLINQLLDISRLESGKMRILAVEGNLARFIGAMAGMFTSLAECKGITYQLNIEAGESYCVFDRDKTEKIVTNLLSNAFKYTLEGGVVSLSLEYIFSDGDQGLSHVRIIVGDTGKGIPSEHLPLIFDRFHQVESSDTREDSSMGIGLSLVKEMTDLLNGTIELESELGRGTTFTVLIPVARSDYQGCDWEDSLPADEDLLFNDALALKVDQGLPPEDMEQSESLKGLPEVLIVEDNADMRAYIVQQLVPEYLTHEARNGEEGMKIAFERIPDLIVSDLMMPVMGGMQMSSVLKADQRTCHIPIIMLTARADKPSKLEGLENGVDDYVIKPFDTDELMARVGNLIKQRERLREKYGNELVLNTEEEVLESPKDQLVQRILEIFEHHISDSDFKMAQLSEELNMSRAQLFRKVQAVTGFTPNDLLRKVRLRKAALLFNNGHHNISQVMYSVGFNNQSYFARCFKDLYKMNPSEYLKTPA